MSNEIDGFQMPPDEDFRAVATVCAARITPQGADFLVGWFASKSPDLVPQALADLRAAEQRRDEAPYYFQTSNDE